MLPRAEALLIAAPLTPETVGLIGAEELALMPPGSFLVNVGRGPMLDDQALIRALESGHLAGAALDVFDVEPLPAESPLWSARNLIISPHTSSHTREAEARGMEIFLENLGRFRRGEPLVNVVDGKRGY